MPLISNDIGSCMSVENYRVRHKDCLEPDLNYCCNIYDIDSLNGVTTTRHCCSFEAYADQHWVTLCAMKSLNIISCVMFVGLLPVFGYILFVIFFGKPTKSRGPTNGPLIKRAGLRDILKSQILPQGREMNVSAVGSLNRIKTGRTKGKKGSGIDQG